MERKASKLSKLFNFVCISILLFVVAAPGKMVTRAGDNSEPSALHLTDDPPPTQDTPPGIEPERPVDVQTTAPGTKILDSDDLQASIRWFGTAGAGFIPSSNSMGWSYGGSGCVHPTTTGQWRANVNLPQASAMKSLFIGYWNYTGSTSTTGQLWKFSAANGSASMIGTVTTGSAAAAGTGFKYSSVVISNTVDNAWSTYMFVWSGAAPATVQELCNMQVGYFPPSIFGVALPTIRK